MLYNVLHNSDLNTLVIMNATEGLPDLAFDKGWRIIHPSILPFEKTRYVNTFNCEVISGAQFYLDYLMDTELDEQDAEYLGSLTDPLWESTAIMPDSDDEEVDVEFCDAEPEEEAEEA